MSQSADEARAARIQKYKEERRKQLTARTATLFSANVTERRPRKIERFTSEDPDHIKSSSELNLNVAPIPLPIRTTRTSRLRAAAAGNSSDSSSQRKSSRSSSVTSLLEDTKQRTSRNSTIDKEKTKLVTNRRQNHEEKENVKRDLGKNTLDIGAIRCKTKHSINKIALEKDKSKNLVISNKVSPRRDNSSEEEFGDKIHRADKKSCLDNKFNKSKTNVQNAEASRINRNRDKELSKLINSPSKRSTNLSSHVKRNVKLKINDREYNLINDSDDSTLKNDCHKIDSFVDDELDLNIIKDANGVTKLKSENSVSVVPILKENGPTGLLGAVCVRKVERFSELLSNLCLPGDPDLLFEDVLAENGLGGPFDPRVSGASSSPCRRAQPSPRTTSTPKRPVTQLPEPDVTAATGSVNKTKKHRRAIEASLSKTENSLPSSRISPKSSSYVSITKNETTVSNSPTTTSVLSKFDEKRKNAETCLKPSCIPLSKKSTDKETRTRYSSVKQDSSDDTSHKSPDNKLKQLTSAVKHTYQGVISKENNRIDRTHRTQKDSECFREKYHNSKKRLTSVENISPNDVTKGQPNQLDENLKIEPDPVNEPVVDFIECNNIEEMFTLHETVRPSVSTSRLSQEMDNLAAFTKQTLDRVNKLSNNLASNKLNLDTSEPSFDVLFGSTSDQKDYPACNYYDIPNNKPFTNRGVNERLRDIDSAAQRLIDFEKQSAMFSDLNSDASSHNRRQDAVSTSFNHTPVSILKRKSIHDDSALSNMSGQAIASPPVTFSPSVVEPRNSRSGNRQRQGILKKRRSLDESQVSRRRSCSPEVSFADDGTPDTNKPILKNRRSSLEDVVRNRSPDGQIQGILKRKHSREDDHPYDDTSHSSPEPHGILKRKSNSSSSSSTASSHVSIAQAVLLAAAGGAEIVDEDKETVRPILKKKSFSEERPCLDILPSDAPKPILKKKSIEHEEHDFDRPKKPILKTSKKLSGEDGNASSFDLSEDDRSSRRPSLLKSRTSDHSGSECETTVRPILKQRGSSLTRERSQSPRPRLSFCADNDTNMSVSSFSCDASESPAGPSRLPNLTPGTEEDANSNYPSAVVRRRNLRPDNNPRSKSLACDVNDELLSILNNRRLKVDEHCKNDECNSLGRQGPEEAEDNKPTGFPSIAARIKSMEQALTKETNAKEALTRSKIRDRDRYRTQPITLNEMRSATSSLEPGQANFQAIGPAGVGSFPSRPEEFSAASTSKKSAFQGEQTKDPFAELDGILDSPPFSDSSEKVLPNVTSPIKSIPPKDHSYGEATFLDFENGGAIGERRQSTLEEIEKEVDKVRVALDEDCRALDEDERHQGEADNWSLNVSCDSGVYNRASSRDSGPHSGEELGLIESQEIKENTATNSITNDWSSGIVEHNLVMNRRRKSTEVEDMRSAEDQGSDDDAKASAEAFGLGLVKSNSVVARASMWQQLQQQARGTPRPLIRHSRSKNKDGPSVVERFKTQPISWQDSSQPTEKEPHLNLSHSKSSANVLDRDEDAKLDEDDPAKLSLMEKMKMFNAKLTHKPPVAAAHRPKEDRMSRVSRLKTMPVLASQVQEAMDQNERLTKSMTHEEVPRNPDFQRKMELFRSASAKNTSLEYIMRQNSKYRSLDLDDDDSPSERAQRMITPEVRGILKSGTTTVPKPKILAKGESSEGLKDEGIDSSSDDESASDSSVLSSEKSCSSSDSCDETSGQPRTKRFQSKAYKNNKLKSSRTDSDLVRTLQDPFPRKIQLPGANEFKDRLNQLKKQPEENRLPVLAKLHKKPEEPKKEEEDKNPRYRRFVKKLDEPIQLGKLRRPVEKPAQQVEEKPTAILKISAMNKEAKNRFFGLNAGDIGNMGKSEKTLEELTAAVRKYIPPVNKSVSTHAMELASGSDGESSGGREVRHINARVRHRAAGGGVQRSATHGEMPHLGSIHERKAALEASSVNGWRTRVCRLSPEREDSKAIERAKNRINETLNAAVDEKKKVQIEDNELGPNILADRRTKLEIASQGWRKRVPQTDANLFTVAGRLERDKATPPPVALPPTDTIPTYSPAPLSPGIPTPNKFRSRKQPASPTNGFSSGPLRSASCAVMGAAVNVTPESKPLPRQDREAFKRSHSLSDSISRLEEEDEKLAAEKTGCSVRVPRADDETFQAFYAPALQAGEPRAMEQVDLDLDAIDSASRQLLSTDYARRAKRERRKAASRNPLRSLAARTDLRDEYSPPPPTGIKERLTRDALVSSVASNCGLAAEALAALATKEDFANVSLRSAAANASPPQGSKPLMLLHVKGRRRVQTRLVEPVHTNVNRGDCFILITTDHVFLYMGLYSNVIERSRSSDIALHVHNTKDLGCKNSVAVITIDEQTKNYSNKHWNQFWSILGVTKEIENYKPVEAGPADEDEIYESCIVQTNMCYEVVNEELVPIQEYWGQVPKIAMLSLSKVIVFDFGSELYIWYGKHVPLESRRRAAQLAQELFDEGYNYEDCHLNPVNAATHQGNRQDRSSPPKQSKTRPSWAILSKVSQHMETILFKEKFLDWPDFTRVIRVKNQENKSNAIEIAPCDAEEMWSNEYQDPDLILEGSHVGRGTQYYDKESMRHYDIKTKSVCKWIIRENDYQKVDNEAELGEFFSGDSYIIRWEYQITVSGRELNGKPSKHNVTGRDRCAYFCWQGKDASSNEKGTAALLTVELDKEKGPQVRVAQGNEPAAFLNLFQGNLIIHQGKRDIDKSRYRLFVTRGNLSNEAYLLQVPCSVRQLRSRGSLLLVDIEKGNLYIWHGSRSLKHIKSVAVELANKLVARKPNYLFGVKVSNLKINEVKEGDEPKEVLEALGCSNKQYYNSVLKEGGKVPDTEKTPRLFHFTDLAGQFEANEVLSPLRHEHLVTAFPFEQKELYSTSQPALFLLDDGSALWMWQGWWPHNDGGGDADPAEKNAGVGAFASRWQSMRAAALRTVEAYWRASRPNDTRPDVRVVVAGLEPRAFIELFDAWSERDDSAEANIAAGYKAGIIVSGECELSRLTSCDAVLPLAELQRRPLPEHVDPEHLERHLAPADFQEAFAMTKEDFMALPAWRQTNMKKEIGLF